jgi:Carboxyltransferase domain, subdomain A and B/Carboxyltransferase domain, subdomain C and D
MVEYGDASLAPMQVLPAGNRAFLIELGDVTAAELHAAAEEWRARGVVIPGHRSLLVVTGGQLPVGGATANRQPATHHIPVVFETAPREVTLTARYLGFRAGFAYLEGWPIPMPRLATSRPVKRGSFAVAGHMAGFYPIDTPGGWNVLGWTNAPLWDPRRESPNLIAQGDVVHVVPVSSLPAAEPITDWEPLGEVIAEVLSPGQLTRIVGKRDWSRVAHGLAPGGPFDEAAAAEANRAVGNPDDAALLECVLVAPALRFRRPRRVAMWDGEVGQLVDGRLKSLRAYIAIEGGLEIPRYAEEAVRVTRGMTLHAAGALIPGPAPRARGAGNEERLRIAIAPGPHQPSISEVECEVTPQIDRVGIRLRPLQPIAIEAPRDMASCGMQFGSVQLHPDGSLVVMGPDHPVTGGYLQPMTVLSSELWKLAQLAPGERVRFYSP